MQKEVQCRQWNEQHGSRPRFWNWLWSWLVISTLYFPFSSNAATTLTNTSYSDLLAAVQSGTNVSIIFATNGTVTFDDTIIITNNTKISATDFGVALSGNNSQRLFDVQSNASLTLIDLSIGNGTSQADDGESGVDGNDGNNFGDNGSNGTDGGGAVAGAIYNSGTLNLSGCIVAYNRVIGGNGGDGGNGGGGFFQGGNGGNAGNGGIALGGAVYNVGSLFVTNTTFTGNSVIAGFGGIGGSAGGGGLAYAGGGGAGAEADGAAIYNLGVATIFASTFSTNTAIGGDSQKAKASGGTGSGGKPGGSGLGGGICNLGTVTMINCTLANNQVSGGSGGNGGDGDFQGGNGGSGGLASGGGVYNGGMAFLTNCTFSGSAAFGGTNGIGGSVGVPGSNGSPGKSNGGNIAGAAGRLIIANSILANGTNGGNGFRTVVTNIFDAGFNVSSDNSLNLTNTGSLKNTNLNLSVLGNYGGLTQTIIPMLGNPAIDRGGVGGCLAVDQRGMPRSQGSNCDAGAVETSGLAIETSPQSQTVVLGTSVLLTIAASGESPLKLQWKLNNSNINRATNTSLSLPNVQFTNAGTYLVVVTNVAGSITSAPAVLKVTAPVSLTAPTVSDATNFSFVFKTTNGFNYYLEYKNELSDANWIRLKTNTGNGNSITNLLPILGTTNRFFRITVE